MKQVHERWRIGLEDDRSYYSRLIITVFFFFFFNFCRWALVCFASILPCNAAFIHAEARSRRALEMLSEFPFRSRRCETRIFFRFPSYFKIYYFFFAAFFPFHSTTGGQAASSWWWRASAGTRQCLSSSPRCATAFCCSKKLESTLYYD